MPTTLYESGAADARKSEGAGSTIYTGTVTNNCDLLGQGKVRVRIPSLGQEVSARLSGPGAGANSGLLYVPRLNDEVLVALASNEAADAFIVNSLWNTKTAPPANPAQLTTKRVFRSGQSAETGHQMTFDDLEQSVTIVTVTGQSVTMDPQKIQLTNLAGTLTITLDSDAQKVIISAPNIELNGTLSVKISAPSVEIAATAHAKLTANGDCTIKGTPVLIN